MNIRIIGLGNVLMSDDGFGPYVVRVLEAFYETPENVQIVDAGTPGLDLTPYLLDADVAIIADTVESGGAPGTIRIFELPDIVRQAPPPRMGPHDPGIAAALLTVAAAGAGPKDVLLLGVVPEWIATGVQLSGPVRSAIAPVIGLILAELDRLGVRLRMRAAPRQPDTWWERDAAPHAHAAV